MRMFLNIQGIRVKFMLYCKYTKKFNFEPFSNNRGFICKAFLRFIFLEISSGVPSFGGEFKFFEFLSSLDRSREDPTSRQSRADHFFKNHN